MADRYITVVAEPKRARRAECVSPRIDQVCVDVVGDSLLIRNQIVNVVAIGGQQRTSQGSQQQRCEFLHAAWTTSIKPMFPAGCELAVNRLLVRRILSGIRSDLMRALAFSFLLHRAHQAQRVAAVNFTDVGGRISMLQQLAG